MSRTLERSFTKTLGRGLRVYTRIFKPLSKVLSARRRVPKRNQSPLRKKQIRSSVNSPLRDIITVLSLFLCGSTYAEAAGGVFAFGCPFEAHQLSNKRII